MYSVIGPVASNSKVGHSTIAVWEWKIILQSKFCDIEYISFYMYFISGVILFWPKNLSLRELIFVWSIVCTVWPVFEHW